MERLSQKGQPFFFAKISHPLDYKPKIKPKIKMLRLIRLREKGGQE